MLRNSPEIRAILSGKKVLIKGGNICYVNVHIVIENSKSITIQVIIVKNVNPDTTRYIIKIEKRAR